jgi:hypothetical protein
MAVPLVWRTALMIPVFLETIGRSRLRCYDALSFIAPIGTFPKPSDRKSARHTKNVYMVKLKSCEKRGKKSTRQLNFPD